MKDLGIPNSTPTCFNPVQIKGLADYKRNCDVVKLNLKTCMRGLSECSENADTNPEFWQSPEFLIGGGVLVFALGLLSGIVIE